MHKLRDKCEFDKHEGFALGMYWMLKIDISTKR